MKILVKILVLMCVISMLGFISAANAQRVVKVAPTEFGILNTVVAGDTTPDGERIDPNTIYELQRGPAAYYIFNGTLEHKGYHLHIRAEAGNGERPKCVPGVLEGGTSNRLFRPKDDITLEGLYLTSVDQGGVMVDKNIVRASKEGMRIVIDDCFFNGDPQSFVRLDAHDQKLFITNSILSYSVLNGRVIDRRGNRADTLVFINNTWYNTMSRCLRGGGEGYVKYAKFDHNTFVNHGEELVQFEECVTSIFTNNLVVNPGFLGDDSPDESNNAIFEFDVLTSADLTGLTQTAEFRNNNVYTDPAITDLFPNLVFGPSVFPDTFRVRQWSLVDSVGELYIDPATVMNEAITFTNGPNIDSILNIIKVVWEQFDGNPDFAPSFDHGNVGGFGEAGFGTVPFDYSYPILTQSYTAGDDGFPLGDLNWFPDKKAEWEAATGVEETGSYSIPGGFKLAQNYPNPFNPSTNIEYVLTKPTRVSLAVYNTVGQKVRTLVNVKQNPGEYTINWDGTNDLGEILSGGVYICRLEAESVVMTSKMVFLK